MAFAAPKPEDRLAFADELAQVRAALAAAKKQVKKNVYREYKKELNEIEVEYQFTLLRSLDLFHKEMLRAKLPDRLYEIKENLADTGGSFSYQTNLPDTNWNWNNIICKQCHKNRLTPMPGTNELCCKICGALETLDGAYFKAEELHNTVQSEEEKYVLNYFLLQVPQSAVAKHACKWDDMLKQFDA